MPSRPRPPKPSRVEHECCMIIYCQCNSQALEPDEKCTVHGGAWWPPRCSTCGRFMPTHRTETVIARPVGIAR
jgi:hypothetical protein